MKKSAAVVAILLGAWCMVLGANRLKVLEIQAPSTVSPGQSVAAHITLEVLEMEGKPYLRPGGAWHFSESKLGGNIPATQTVPWKLADFKVGDRLKYTVKFTVPEKARVGERGSVRFRVSSPSLKQYATLVGGDRAVFTVAEAAAVELEAPAVAAGGLPVAAVPTTAEAPVIDGVCGEPLWGRAATLPVAVDCADGRPSPHPATLKIITDRKFIYLAMRAEDPGVQAHAIQRFPMHDGKVWINDGMECLFTAAAEAGRVEYAQFIADLAGQHYDSMNGDYHGFNPPWKSAASRDERGWTIEAAIPVDAIAREGIADGAVWRAGFFRFAESGRRSSGWTATMGSHSNIPRHGYLIFGTPGDVLDRECAFVAAVTERSSAKMQKVAAQVKAVREGAARADASALPEALARLEMLRRQYEALAFSERFSQSALPLVIQEAFPYTGEVAPDSQAKTGGVEADFFPGEVRDFAYNLTNVSERTVTVRAGIHGIPAARFSHNPKSRDYLIQGIPGFPARLFAPAAAATFDGRVAEDVLAPNPAGVWRIAPHETAQIFLRVRADGEATRGEGALVVEGIDGGAMTLVALPMRFQVRGETSLGQASRPLVFGWDYVPEQIARQRPAFIQRHHELLREYGFNTVMLSGLRHFPRPKADPQGNLIGPLDFTVLREHLSRLGKGFDYCYLDLAIWEKRVLRKDLFGLDFDSPAYEKAFKAWFQACAKELKSLGVPNNRLLVCPVDECSDRRAQTIARWVKECDPATRIIIDNSSHDMERVRAMDRYTDVWMPHIRTLRQEAMAEFHRFVEQTGKPRLLYYYCSGGNEKLKHPYQDYILHFHLAFARGFGGLGYWAAGQYYGSPWYRRAYPQRVDTALLYPVEGDAVPSRRLAAWHRGVQDLWLLRETASRYRGDEAVQRKLLEAAQNAVDYPRDPARAEKLRQYCRTLLEAKPR